ncbi:MAG: sugar phosphate isomerase/epimerase [Clostridia bacterium]|nr:sugar phosphate isomerase/epimerase [Clostridia bacterium]
MLLVQQTDVTAARFGMEKAIEMIAHAGFDGLDYSAFGMLNDDDPLNQSDYIAYAKNLKSKADSCGIKFVQAHAPFPSSKGENEFDKTVKERIIRSMEACAIMGVEIIVVHPKQHLPYMSNVEALFDINMEFYSEMIAYGEKFGIRIATENMFQYDEHRRIMRDSTCASPQEFCKYIDTVNSPYLTGCLDIGHCGLCGREPQDIIRYMGSDRISCLHIHDNNYMTDNHTLPCTRGLNWNEICKALADIGYRGHFTYEADNFLKAYDNCFIATALKFMHDTGRYLIEKINSYK